MLAQLPAALILIAIRLVIETTTMQQPPWVRCACVFLSLSRACLCSKRRMKIKTFFYALFVFDIHSIAVLNEQFEKC